MTAHIKILILNWNGKHLLKPCLDSIKKIDYSNYSVMVIDNASTDNSVKMVNENFPEVDILELKINYKSIRSGMRFLNVLICINIF